MLRCPLVYHAAQARLYVISVGASGHCYCPSDASMRRPVGMRPRWTRVVSTTAAVAAASTLGVSTTAAEGEVRARLRACAKLHHPDVGGDPEAMKHLTAAARTLLEAQPGTTEATGPGPSEDSDLDRGRRPHVAVRRADAPGHPAAPSPKPSRAVRPPGRAHNRDLAAVDPGEAVAAAVVLLLILLLAAGVIPVHAPPMRRAVTHSLLRCPVTRRGFGEPTSAEVLRAAATLDVPVDASLLKIKKHFRAKAQVHHPDAGGSDDDMKRVAAAMRLLKETPHERRSALARELDHDTGGGDDAFSSSIFRQHAGACGREEAGAEDVGGPDAGTFAGARGGFSTVHGPGAEDEASMLWRTAAAANNGRMAHTVGDDAQALQQRRVWTRRVMMACWALLMGVAFLPPFFMFLYVLTQ